MNRFEQYFAGITDEELKQHKDLVRKIRKATNTMIRKECNKLRERGY